eukprot:TRINITY_DN11490_c0_g1_i2.p1 TRINITY_DN11490_c0_g1~~TRINITY_DN11490_c0_g1_i2.p1  ORF type:complete len:495 (+),score=123.24 TRINITY_DN11490_c0_g1_i2:59-1543(+)
MSSFHLFRESKFQFRRWSSSVAPLRKQVSEQFLKKTLTIDDCIQILYKSNNKNLAFSGYRGVGAPKVVPNAFVEYVKKNRLEGTLRYNLFDGNGLSAEWNSLLLVPKVEAEHSEDQHDIAVIEAAALKDGGRLILGPSVGDAPQIIQNAKKIIVEINSSLPVSFEGLHDITTEKNDNLSVSMSRIDQRIGQPFIQIPEEKILGVIEGGGNDVFMNPNHTLALDVPSEAMEKLVERTADFMKKELGSHLSSDAPLPIYFFGDSAMESHLFSGVFQNRNAQLWTDVLSEHSIRALDEGRCSFASATAIQLHPEKMKLFLQNVERYRDLILLRDRKTIAHPEISRRMVTAAVHYPSTFDIYGRYLGSHQPVKGKISVLVAPSFRPTKVDETGISTIVPLVSEHQRPTEHLVDVIITERGVADIRGLSPVKRAHLIIEKCVHPHHRLALESYLQTAKRDDPNSSEPQLLPYAFKMQEHLENNGTMKIKTWNGLDLFKP